MVVVVEDTVGQQGVGLLLLVETPCWWLGVATCGSRAGCGRAGRGRDVVAAEVVGVVI